MGFSTLPLLEERKKYKPTAMPTNKTRMISLAGKRASSAKVLPPEGGMFP